VDKLDNLYDKDGITVRRAKIKDALYLSNNLRQSDVDEIWASHHITPKDALIDGVNNSIFACTVCNGYPIAMFGIVPETILGTKASVWMLASDDLKKIKRRFAKNSRHFIDMMLEFYPYIYNHVDDRNKESIKWLEFCGAHIKSDPEPFGVEQMPFHYFYFNKARR